MTNQELTPSQVQRAEQTLEPPLIRLAVESSRRYHTGDLAGPDIKLLLCHAQPDRRLTVRSTTSIWQSGPQTTFLNDLCQQLYQNLQVQVTHFATTHISVTGRNDTLVAYIFLAIEQ